MRWQRAKNETIGKGERGMMGDFEIWVWGRTEREKNKQLIVLTYSRGRGTFGDSVEFSSVP